MPRFVFSMKKPEYPNKSWEGDTLDEIRRAGGELKEHPLPETPNAPMVEPYQPSGTDEAIREHEPFAAEPLTNEEFLPFQAALVTKLTGGDEQLAMVYANKKFPFARTVRALMTEITEPGAYDATRRSTSFADVYDDIAEIRQMIHRFNTLRARPQLLSPEDARLEEAAIKKMIPVLERLFGKNFLQTAQEAKQMTPDQHYFDHLQERLQTLNPEQSDVLQEFPPAVLGLHGWLRLQLTPLLGRMSMREAIGAPPQRPAPLQNPFDQYRDLHPLAAKYVDALNERVEEIMDTLSRDEERIAALDALYDEVEPLLTLEDVKEAHRKRMQSAEQTIDEAIPAQDRDIA